MLSVQGLRIGVMKAGADPLVIVDRADLECDVGQILGIVGESGSGKSMLCRSFIGTLGRHDATILSGNIRFRTRQLDKLTEAEWRRVRGRDIGYIPQSSLAGLNPVMTIGKQLGEALSLGRALSRREIRKEAFDLLERVHIGRPESVLAQHAHHLSGGMRQRVMIACALSQRPNLLVADEPTTGLDVTTQHEIMKLLHEIRNDLGTSIILVSHDLALIEDVCDTVSVMHAGATVESGPVMDVLREPRHPYTLALMRSRIDLADPGAKLDTILGHPPSVGSWPSGCRYAPRCSMTTAACQAGEHPRLVPVGAQLSACIRASDLGSES